VEQTLLVSDQTCPLFCDTDPDEPIERLIERLFAGYDLVLVEGYKHGPFPKIEVYRRLDTRADPLAGEVDVIAVVTKEKVALPDGQMRSPTLSKRSSCSSEMVIDKAFAEVQNRFTTKDTKSTKESKELRID